MFDQLRKLLGKASVDYADARYEVRKDCVVRFDGKELSQIGATTTDGYVLRVLKDGGFASVAFTKPEDGEKALATAVENAGLIGRHRDKPVTLAPAPPIKETVAPKLVEDPRQVAMEEKLALVRGYNDIALGHEKIVMTTMAYQDMVREKHFVSTEGAEIREDLVTTRLVGQLIAKDGTLTQNVRLAAGGSNGFQSVRDQNSLIKDRSRIVQELLNARPIAGGEYRCVLNPSLAGVFTHEAFGHFSEADIVETLPAMREKMQLGNQLGSEILSIVDNATLPDQLGHYKYDDEGVAVRPVQLIKEGRLVGRLHSRRTAAEFGEPLSGHSIAEDHRYAPIIRMGTIFIEAGSFSKEELLAQLGDGYYFLDAKGGQTAGENFSFGTQYGYEVKNGKPVRLVRDINISGNLYSTLREISAVANDFSLSKTGGCGKGQTNQRSCYGGSHILVNNLVVGGV
jgi:predicted Zn-dependent protease